MKKTILLLLTLSAVSFTLSAKDLSKEEKKRIKSELKDYLKHPEAYQQMIANYKTTIDTQEVQLAMRKTSITQLSANLNEQHNKITNLEGELKTCQNKPVPTCPDCPKPGAIPSGMVYKVQVGLFKKMDLASYMSEPKYFGIEKDNDKNRYVISYFTDKTEAEKFVADLRKFGIRGAFISKYENGQRIVASKSTKKSSAKKK